MTQTDKASFIGIQRLRVGRDGLGVTTLVGFHGCPLKCRYCLNPHSLKPEGEWKRMTPAELLAQVQIDDIYFQSTGGGVCFGGGEPALHPDFILAFRELCPEQWRITIETSLNVPVDNIKRLMPAIDQWIIDIKDLNDDTYLDYTGKNNIYVIRNLMQLCDAPERCLIRIPLIPDYNTPIDTEASETRLRELGFNNFDHLTYITDPQTLRK